jgi:transcriptional regulator with XRE-family HTH domain
VASPKPSDKLADILRRVKATGLSDQEVHDRAKLASGWLSQARQGRYSATAPSVRKLDRWLKRFEAGVSEAATAAEIGDDELGEDEEETVARAIARAISGGAKTHAEITVIRRRLAAALLVGDVDEARGELALHALKGLEVSIKLEREENAHSELRALELLTPDEERLLAEHRAKVAGPPVQPGQYVKPPEGGPV